MAKRKKKRLPQRLTVEISQEVMNEAYWPMLRSEKRYLVFYGGAGSGKSYFIVQRYLIRLLESRRCNLLVVRQVARSNRNSTFALFRQVIRDWGLSELFVCQETEMKICCAANENCVLFAGLDDVEKLKSLTFPSGELTDVWIEEASQISESDFNQLDVRLRGGTSKKQVCISFNPINVNHWLKKRFFERRGGDVEILHTTYRDNRFLDAEYCKVLEGYRETDPYYYEVYCLGQWGVFGRTVFDAHAVNRRLAEISGEEKRYRFSFAMQNAPEGGELRIADESIRLEESEDGEITIYRKVEEGVPYVIGCDTAGEGSDFFAAQVLDNRTGEQVAVLHSEYDEDVFARQVYCLGRYYNTALVGIEANFSTYPIRELERLGYENQFVRQVEDSFTHQTAKAFGVKTTASTRPVMIAGLVREIRERVDGLWDRETMLELLTFVRNEKGRPEAQNGAHDDLVMSLAIAHYIRPQQSDVREVKQAVRKRIPVALWSGENELECGNGVMEW